MATCGCEKPLQAPCRPRRVLDYVTNEPGQEVWRCPACSGHYEDPVCMPCGDVVCRACVTIGGFCPICHMPVTGQVFPIRPLRHFVDGLQCRCPNRGLGCAAVVGVLDVEHHLQAECEWREEECDQCHQQVRRAEMARHKDTTCPTKPMACGYVGCGTSSSQSDLAAHERGDVGLLRQCLAGTSLELAQTRHELAQTKAVLAESQAAQCGTAAALAQTQQSLSQTQHNLAQTKAQLQEQLAQVNEQTKAELAAVRTQIDQLFIIPPAAPEGLEARWDETTKEVALNWQPVPPCSPIILYRVQATLALPADLSGISIVYTGPECHCRYRFPPGAVLGRAEARFVVAAIRGLAESGPSAPATCARRAVFRYNHDMDKQGLFFYIGTQGRTQPWQNPAVAGWVTTTRSSGYSYSGSASDALGRRPCESYTHNQPTPSWWQVDLGAGRLFTPTHYTLRHSEYPGNVEERLQSWRLEGSVDGADGSWRTLDEHTNEPHAIPARGGAMATFAVAPERAFPARLFRVLMTGPSPSGSDYLHLAGLEMYGTLLQL
ncbi:putative E3 ubiquitin-protein ligase HECTD1 [Paratrimastix pyriformis]|uniref:E3 ubiquitin-protein ligase HECTD1 n=1 Tax=Paratrimastix pyriformis TaxID=342808 RepID=A0ABQ8UJU5_9EUKA|nr:putative E3 ubiquitin-protein ligase HECTD1 [Paratrimastix pyriformis]